MTWLNSNDDVRLIAQNRGIVLCSQIKKHTNINADNYKIIKYDTPEYIVFNAPDGWYLISNGAFSTPNLPEAYKMFWYDVNIEKYL